MEFKDFCQKVVGELTAFFEGIGQPKSIQRIDVKKNNGTVFAGISIREEGVNISPTIYLEQLYEAFSNGMEFDKVLEEIVTIYEENKPSQEMDFSCFMNYDRIRDRIVYKLIHYEKNKELLQDTPYMKYLDLALVFYCLFSQSDEVSSSILIRKEHLKMWNVSKEDLLRAAAMNTPRMLKAEVIPIEELLIREYEKMIEDGNQSLELEEGIRMLKESIRNGDTKMYVLSNSKRIQGACCVLYKGVLKNLADKLDQNLFILPSSIHEVILVPAGEEKDSYVFSQMVEEINMTQVKNEEVLSNQVYYYDRILDEVRLSA